ncbi:sensor histidine kinase [Pseudoxanthomonas dokdonensis]|uniref:Histidine kinase n=1 Tax=Pseudoxanthomonas dokdonensis TaxID=344882 RepID=A0A0R0CSU7_9GAMM|nr:histidine kinase [Pseudoxanthomonas dokdonensis]KRG69159.1 histidine kinase [Pseudoxanthomonas dokdonensis]
MSDSRLPVHPIDALWQAPVLIWTLLAGEGLAVILSLAPGVSSDRWVYFGLASLVIQWVLLLSLGVLYLARRWLFNLQPQFIAYLALLAMLAATWAIFWLSWRLTPGMWSGADTDWRTPLLRFTGIAVTVGLLALAAFQNHWQARQLAVRASQSELESLQARIRPHFLFNTLNTAASLVHQQPGRAETLLLDLSDLFRAALRHSTLVSLREELSLAQRYLQIEVLRLGPRLRLEWDVAAMFRDIRIPSLSLQPLVENAIRHGIEPLPDGGTLSVKLVQNDNAIVIEVSNSIDARHKSIDTTGHQIGLSGVRARLRAMLGDSARLETRIESERYVATLYFQWDA